MSVELPARLAEDEKPANNPPMRLSFCEPKRVLHGGMSLVYLCDTAAGGAWDADEVAVKRLNAEINAIPGAAERFLRECYLWLQLGRHPNVVSALSAHHAAFEAPLLVLEYVPRSLRQVMGRAVTGSPVAGRRVTGRPVTGCAELDLRHALRLVIGIADGLAYVRETLPGFVHADLKPENVLTAADGTAKITDLGLSHVLTADALHPAASASWHATSTTASGLVGTLLYAAPEQIVERQAVQASDIYALGCVAHELIAGEPAYGPPTSAADYLLRHLHRQPAALDTLRRGLPSSLAQLVVAMLAKSPGARPELAQLSTELRAIAARVGLEVPVPVAAPGDPSRRLAAAQGLANLGLDDDAIHAASRITAELADPADPADPAEPGEPEDKATRLWGHFIIARASTRRGDPARANRELDAASELLTDNTAREHRASYHTERVRVALALEDLAAAATHSKAAVEAQPQYSRMYANAALVLERAGRLDEAIEMLTGALRIAGDFGYFSHLVNLLREAGRWDEARSVCDRMVEFHPQVGQGYVLRAITLRLAADRSPMTVGDAAELKKRLSSDFASAQRYAPLDPEVRSLLESLIAGLPDPPTPDA